MRLAERIWFGNDRLARSARLLLTPAATVFRSVILLRGWLYDSELLKTEGAGIPVVSVGNLTVGGTGKTPVVAWLASRLTQLGTRPAIVLRGYGGDEELVHARLNPGVPVLVGADRIAAVRRAAADGATVAILDDAFQHRRARRSLDIVLVSADQWGDRRRLLPAGPWREDLEAARRAQLAIVTRRTASRELASEIAAALRSVAPELPVAVVHLAAVAMAPASGGIAAPPPAPTPLGELAGRRVTAVAGIGNPAAFFEQLAEAGALVRAMAFPDHHRYSPRDAGEIAEQAASTELVVCTLKDAVKLATLWPAGGISLWYVLQQLEVESGAVLLEEMITRLDRTDYS